MGDGEILAFCPHCEKVGEYVFSEDDRGLIADVDIVIAMRCPYCGGAFWTNSTAIRTANRYFKKGKETLRAVSWAQKGSGRK